MQIPNDKEGKKNNECRYNKDVQNIKVFINKCKYKYKCKSERNLMKP